MKTRLQHNNKCAMMIIIITIFYLILTGCSQRPAVIKVTTPAAYTLLSERPTLPQDQILTNADVAEWMLAIDNWSLECQYNIDLIRNWQQKQGAH